MKRQDQSERTGVIITNEADRPVLDAFLVQQGIEDARWFAPGDLADLDSAIRHEQIGRVVATNPAGLLAGMWEQEIVFDEWPSDVHIDYVEAPEAGHTLRFVARSWRSWSRSHRRRQALAGGVLSFLVLGISFALCVWLAR